MDFSIGTNLKKNCLTCDKETHYDFKLYCNKCLNSSGYRRCNDCRKFKINNSIKPYWVLLCRKCFNK